MLKFLLATLLIFGFCCGIGFIVLPVIIGQAGFWPGVLCSFLIWPLIFLFSLLYLEAVLAFPDGSNVHTMTKKLLGKGTAVLGSFVFIYISYSFIASYFTLSGFLITHSIQEYWGVTSPHFLSTLLFMLIFGLWIYLGTKWSALINLLFALAFLVCIGAIIIFGFPSVSQELISRYNPLYFIFLVPALFYTFFFQPIIPTLATFLNRHRTQLIASMATGLGLAFVMFLLWLWIILGSTAQDILIQAFDTDLPMYERYLLLTSTPHIGKWVYFLIIFAVITSFIASALSFLDFYGDLLEIPIEQRRGNKRFLLCLLIFIPSFLISQIYQGYYLKYINLVDGLGEVVIGAILPISWVWTLRFLQDSPSQPIIPGSKIFLIFLAMIAFLLLYLEGMQLIFNVAW